MFYKKKKWHIKNNYFKVKLKKRSFEVSYIKQIKAIHVYSLKCLITSYVNVSK